MLTTILSKWCALAVCAAGAGIGTVCVHAADADAGARPAILESETSDVGILAPMGPHRLLLGGALGAGIKVINGDTARLEGQIQAAPASNFVIDPANRFVYVAETMWTRLNRGTRQDLLSIYDPQLKLVSEITLPGRLISVPKSPSLDISADGKLGLRLQHAARGVGGCRGPGGTQDDATSLRFPAAAWFIPGARAHLRRCARMARSPTSRSSRASSPFDIRRVSSMARTIRFSRKASSIGRRAGPSSSPIPAWCIRRSWAMKFAWTSPWSLQEAAGSAA